MQRIDASAPAIHNTANAMMKHYDRSTSVAVLEWRNCLSTARRDQFLPLLYVANEVMQTSKRNRGKAFLEAFSPVLGQSLIHMCQTDPSQTEKVRRTVKIWGDRQVFSVRFVQELLKGLERYRNVGGGGSGSGATQSPEEAQFSPVAEETVPEAAPASPEQQSMDDDDIMNIMEDNSEAEDEGNSGGGNDDDDDDDSDDDDLFLDHSGRGQKLNVEFNIDSVLAQNQASPVNKSLRNAKRRRGSAASGAASASTGSHSKRRRATLSNNNLLDVWNRLNALQQNYEHAQLMLEKIDTVNSKTLAEELEHLVGDELQQSYRQTISFRQQLVAQRKNLHDIAQERKVLQQEAIRYLPWLEAALKQDEDDIRFSDELELKLQSFQKIHPAVVDAHESRLAEEAQRVQAEEEKERRLQEQEEAEKFRAAALSKELEAKPGMVWNPVTREYQARNTDESWRD
jgi:hypothetical protein